MDDAQPGSRRFIELIGGFETTFLPGHNRDVAETTEHDVRWRDDLELLRAHGVTRLRYPARWHRIEQSEGRYDWRHTDEVFGYLHDRGCRPIVDLVHHTSYPQWLDDGFGDPRFPSAYLRFAEAIARRYPWIDEYTLFNEPFSTLFLAGHEAIWPPYRDGLSGFVSLLRNVIPAVTTAQRMYQQLLPEAKHVFVDTCEHHYAMHPSAQMHTDLANDRRFFVADLFRGAISEDNAFLPLVLAAGGDDLLDMVPASIDVLGLDYYPHCQWDFHVPERGGETPASGPITLAAQIIEYWEHFQLPCMLSETNVRGFASDRATWLKYTLEQMELARDAGVPVDGLCWFPFIDSADWDSLLFRCEGNIDPVGVYWLDEDLNRRSSSMTRSFAAAAAGAPSSTLPAYRFQEPVATWLRGYLPHMSHWSWQPPPEEERCSTTSPHPRFELRIVDAS